MIDFSKLPKPLSAEEQKARDQRQLANLTDYALNCLKEAGFDNISPSLVRKEQYSFTLETGRQTNGLEVIAQIKASGNSRSETKGFMSVRIAVKENAGNQNYHDIFFPQRANHLNGFEITTTDQKSPPAFQALAKIFEAAKTKSLGEMIPLMQEEAEKDRLRERSGGSTNRIALNLPFSKKDEMKSKYGTKLDWVGGSEKTWYFIGDNLPDDLKPFQRKPAPKKEEAEIEME